MRDEHYSPFTGPPPASPPREAITVFVMARLCGDRTDSMCGALRTGPHGWDVVYTRNGELYQSQWFAAEALARAGPGDASGRTRPRFLKEFHAGAISRIGHRGQPGAVTVLYVQRRPWSPRQRSRSAGWRIPDGGPRGDTSPAVRVRN